MPLWITVIVYSAGVFALAFGAGVLLMLATYPTKGSLDDRDEAEPWGGHVPRVGPAVDLRAAGSRRVVAFPRGADVVALRELRARNGGVGRAGY